MKVKDYAEDVNLSTAEILKRCRELGIKAEKGEDTLNDDDIIILDNTINLIEWSKKFCKPHDIIKSEQIVEIIFKQRNVKALKIFNNLIS